MKNTYFIINDKGELLEQYSSTFITNFIECLIQSIHYIGYELVEEMDINDLIIQFIIDGKSHKVRFDFVGEYKTIILDGYESNLDSISDYIKCNF